MDMEPEFYSPNQSVRHRVNRILSTFADPDACWLWPMSCQKAGYGQLSTSEDGKRECHYAHRVSYLLVNGPIAKGLHICHKCDNPPCINPHHLFIGTAQDNALDCAAKGRNSRGKKFPVGDQHWTRRNREKLENMMLGENHFASKLTVEDVRHIRASPETGVIMAERYGVTTSTISSIRRYYTWKNV